MATTKDCTPQWVIDEVEECVAADDFNTLVSFSESYARVSARYLADGATEHARGFAAAFVYAESAIDRLFETRDRRLS